MLAKTVDQVLDQILTEVRLKDKYRNRIDEWLHDFNNIVLAMDSGQSYALTDQFWTGQTRVPIIQEPYDVPKASFQFVGPKVCRVVGSHATATNTGPTTTVEVAVEMPAKCWQRHDNLNHRYHRKRALYLSHICQKLVLHEMVGDVRFKYWNGCHTKPVLIVEPKGDIRRHLNVVLTAYPESDRKSIDLFHMIPERNNVRSNWLGLKNGEDLPTPSYNSSVAHDLNLIANNDFIAEKMSGHKIVKDCLNLLNHWLKQRKLESDFGFIVSMFVSFLIETNKISHNFNVYHIFRTTLLSIANSQWDSIGLSLAEDTDQSLDYYLSYFPVVLLDITGRHNLCWDITLDLYYRLKHESRLTIEALDTNRSEVIYRSLMEEVLFEHKFDSLLTISVASLLKSSKVTDISSDVIDCCGDTITAFVGHLVPLLRRTVGQRALLIQHKPKSVDTNEWTTTESPPHPNSRKHLTFGLLIDSQNAYNNAERGPEADTPEAKEFREFWGNRSELRRFGDSSICETVYWKTKCWSEQRKIVDQSIQYILSNILEIASDGIAFTTSILDPMLERQLRFDNKETTYGTGEEFGLLVGQQLEALAKQLRALDGLPLSITSVQGIDAVFRGTEVYPPIAANSGKSSHHSDNCNIFDLTFDKRVVKYFKPLQVMIDMEGSGKWPDSLDAFLRVKASFYIEIGKQLAKQYGLLCRPTAHYLDIFQNGWIFRVLIGSHKELVLRRQLVTSDGRTKPIASGEADRLETEFEVMPKLNSALSALNRTHRCYGSASRLAKRWISSQMMAYYLNDVAIDLLMAYIFVRPEPYTVPNSPIVAFVRFLSLICSHNWKSEPIIVELNNDETETDKLDEIRNAFTKQRHSYPVMFVTTTYDKHWSQWTRLWPDLTIVKRLQVLSQSARETLVAQMERPFNANPRVIFNPDLTVFDVLIVLKWSQMARDESNEKVVSVKQFDDNESQRVPIIGFDPIDRYYRQLIDCYSQFALFFYDPLGGRHIGVALKPEVFKHKAFNDRDVTLAQMSNSCDQKGRNNTDINVEALVEDFAVMGDSIVDRIELQMNQ